MILREFQNGKVSLCSLKINQDTTKNVKSQILKNISFCLEKDDFLTKTVIFQNSNFYIFFVVSRLIFELHRPTLPFWNCQNVYFEYANR